MKIRKFFSRKSGNRRADTFSLRTIAANGITIRAAVEGSGPLVILVHGFPEIWYSWRHQIKALANAGYRVVAPDVRGYGGTDRPYPVEAYDMVELTSDIVGLIDELGEDSAILVGHDWGATICWNTAILYPDRVSGVTGLSVPYQPRGEMSPIELWKQLYDGRFFFHLYFQEEGVAEAELEADIRTSLRKLYHMASGDRTLADIRAIASKLPDDNLLDGIRNPNPFPPWLTEEDIDYFVEAFTQSGFRGPLNRYRAQQRDWERLPQLSERTVDQPSSFIGGAFDIVRTARPGVDAYENAGAYCTDFRGATIIDGEGHWIQQEAPEAVNRELLSFLSNV